MPNIHSSFLDLSHLDALSAGESPIHRVDPRAKVATALFFIIAVVSFGKYEVSRLLPFAIYPVALMAAGNIPFGTIGRKVVAAAPFALFVAIFNPFIDRAPAAYLGYYAISGGTLSFLSIMLRFVLTVSAALVLVATTGLTAVCAALASMGVPKAFTTQLLFLYRYLFVLGDEATRMSRARALRSFGGRGMGMGVYGQMLGQLLLRTMDRAQRIHLAMLCRGFDGEIRLLRPLRASGRDLLFVIGWCCLFAALRVWDVPGLIGAAVTGLFS